MDNVQEQRKMIIKFHVLLNKAGVDNEGKQDLLSVYGVESSKDLTVEQLKEICNGIQKNMDNNGKKDRLRKRVIRAVCQLCERIKSDKWLDFDNERRLIYAKAIVCRVAGAEHFNRIGEDRLRSIAFSFEKQVKDMDGVMEEVGEILREI